MNNDNNTHQPRAERTLDGDAQHSTLLPDRRSFRAALTEIRRTNRLEMLRQLPENSVDLVLASPTGRADVDPTILDHPVRALKPGGFLLLLLELADKLAPSPGIGLTELIAERRAGPPEMAIHVYVKGTPSADAPRELPELPETSDDMEECFDSEFHEFWRSEVVCTLVQVFSRPHDIVLIPFGDSMLSAAIKSEGRNVVSVSCTSDPFDAC